MKSRIAVWFIFGLLTAELLMAIVQRPVPSTIESGCEIGYPPYCFVTEEGEADGFSVALFRAAVARMNRDAVFQTGAWSDIKGLLARGEITALPLVGRTPEREDVFDFTFPYLTLHGAIVVRDSETRIHNLDDLAGRQVAVMKGDNAEEFLRRHRADVSIHPTPTFVDALKQLAHGACDAVLIQRLLAVKLIDQTNIQNLRILNVPVQGFKQEFCFAVKKGDRETLAMLNEGLAMVMADGTFARLQKEWFGTPRLPSGSRLVIGGDFNYPPYEFIDQSGRPSGYNINLTRALAHQIGYDVEFRLGPWAEVKQSLISGAIDAVPGMFSSEEREHFVDFSPPHTVIHHVAVVRKGDEPVPTTVEDLIARKIVVMRGDIMHEWALDQGLESQVTAVATQEEALSQLEEGDFDCALIARVPALYWIAQNHWDDLVVGASPVLSAEYCYAVPEGQRILLSQISEGLKTLHDSGEYQEIYRKWLGVYDDTTRDFGFILRIVALVAIPLLLLLTISFIWSQSLKRQVRRKTADLRMSEERLRTIVEHSTNIFYSHDTNHQLTYVSPQVRTLLGLEPEEAMVRWTELATENPINLDGLDLTQRAIGTGVTQAPYELELSHRDGSAVRVEVREAPVVQDGVTRAIVGALTDITERRRAEEERRVTAKRLHLMVGLHKSDFQDDDELADYGLHAGIDLSKSEFGFLGFMNDAEDEMTMYSWSTSSEYPGEESGRGGRLLVGESGIWGEPVRERRKVLINDSARPESSRSGTAADHVEIRRYLGIPIFDQEAIVAVAAFVNKREQYTEHDAHSVTLLLQDMWQQIVLHRERRQLAQLEASARRAQHMESLGVLAGGVAHDFNNLLGAITGYADVARLLAEPASKTEHYLKQILVASERAAELISKILTFSRHVDGNKTVVSLGPLIRETAELLRRMLPSSIHIECDIAVDVPPVSADATQLQQVIMNLGVNALHAMPDGGRLVLSLDTREASGREDLHAIEGVLHVHLAVSDTGVGIDPEILDRIFEPFFTTKDIGKGSGMGLSTSYGIIAGHDGFMSVDSTVGAGSVFHVFLPPAKGAPNALRPQENPAIDRGRERILIVDDEPVMLDMVSNMLKQLGYDVTPFSSSLTALSELEQTPANWDAVITDQTMPNLEGAELLRRVRGLGLDIPVIIMTGHSEKLTHDEGGGVGADAVLKKPFRIKELTEILRSVLAEDAT